MIKSGKIDDPIYYLSFGPIVFQTSSTVIGQVDKSVPEVRERIIFIIEMRLNFIPQSFIAIALQRIAAVIITYPTNNSISFFASIVFLRFYIKLYGFM